MLIMALFFYYKVNWISFSNAIVKVDHQSQFLYDFVHHYYPMGKTIFEFKQLAPGYYYTSFFAILIAPICKLEIQDAIFVWSIMQIGWFVLLFYIGKYLIQFPYQFSVLYIFILLTSYPILNNFKWGQVSILLTVLILLSFAAAQKGKDLTSSSLLALAVAIKYYPIIFLLYFVFQKKYKLCVAFFICLIFFYFLIPVIFIGYENWFKFESESIRALSNNKGPELDPNSQYFFHVVSRWIEGLEVKRLFALHTKMVSIIGYAIAGICFLMAYVFQRNKKKNQQFISIVPIFLSIPFLVKSSWPHYFVYLPFCQIAVIYYFFINATASKIIRIPQYFFVIISVLSSGIFVFDLWGHWSFFNKYGMLFLSNLSLLVALIFLIKPSEQKPQ